MGCRCDHLLPWWDVGLGIEDRGEQPLCVLAGNHDGPHEFLNDAGETVCWQTDYCDDCDTPDDYCGCYVFWIKSPQPAA